MTDHVIQVADAADVGDDAVVEEPVVIRQLHTARSADEDPQSGEFAPSSDDPTPPDTRPFRIARAATDEPHPNAD